MITGTVKFYNSTKGFGFITPDQGGRDAFVHVTALERAGIAGLGDGQKVSYDLENGRDGRESGMRKVVHMCPKSRSRYGRLGRD